MSRPKLTVSVAMATYNGEEYIQEQLESILPQLVDGDEIVISDDGSTDRTIQVIEEIKKRSELCIRVIKGPQKGIFRNFENALINCNNQIIFLSDQDDIWLPDKISRIKGCFQKEGIDLVVHNGCHFMEDKKIDSTQRLVSSYHKGIIRNILFSSYWGCCMAFKKQFIMQYLPFICRDSQHDQLIGLLAEKKGNVCWIDECLIYHRVHDFNQTHPLPIHKKIRTRYILVQAYMELQRRLKENSK